MSLQFKITFNKYIKKVMYYESKAEFSVAITTVFSDKQSFRNHSNVQICRSRNSSKTHFVKWNKKYSIAIYLLREIIHCLSVSDISVSGKSMWIFVFCIWWDPFLQQ